MTSQPFVALAAHNFIAEYRDNFKTQVVQSVDARNLVFDVIPEENNPHDKRALGVWVNGLQVGYIKKSDQAIIDQYRPEMFNGPTKLYIDTCGETGNGQAYWVNLGLSGEPAPPLEDPNPEF